MVMNLSLNEVYIGPFGDVSATRGVRLGPSGGFMRLTHREDFSLVGYEWYAVATGAASDVLVLEVCG
jgi:hypothetical protein